MKRQPLRCTPASQLGGCRAIHMQLPVERREQTEVVRLGSHPRQPIAAMNASRVTRAQIAVSIVDRRLRDDAEHEASQRIQSEQRRERARYDVNAHLRGNAPAATDELENAVGRRDEASRERDALWLVAIEDAGPRPPSQHRRQLPREVHGVADAGVHSLPAHRAVDMRCIAEQEGAPLPKARRDPVMHVVGRKPIHASNVDA